MQTVLIIATASAVISSIEATLPAITDDSLQSAFCKVTACARPGIAMPGVLYHDGIAKCKTLKAGCFDRFGQCAEGIAKIIGLKPKTPENNDGNYDMEDVSDAFLKKVKKAIISFSAHNIPAKSATQTFWLTVPKTSAVWILPWFVCVD